MNRLCALVLLAITGGPLFAEEPSKGEKVKKLAVSLADATKKNDVAGVVDHTYPAVIEFLGGREKAISRIDASMKQMKDNGIEVRSVDVGAPGEFLTEGKNTFVIIPTTTVMGFAKGSLKSKSYLLGISPDEGKTWTFLDGAGLQTPTYRDKVLPKLPEKLKLPEKQKPELVLPKKDD